MKRSNPLAYVFVRLFLLFLGSSFVVAPTQAADVLPSPHDNSHLIVIHSAQLNDEKGTPAKSTENIGATFDKAAIALDRPVVAHFKARYAGSYTLWVRVGQAPGASSPVDAQVLQDDKILLEGGLNSSNGQPGLGGPDGYREYREKAIRNTPHNVVGDPDLIQLRDLAAAKTAKKETKEDDLSNELMSDIRSGTGENWTNTGRVDKLNKDFPFYWWKIGQVTLARGEYSLKVAPRKTQAAAPAPLMDAAILTTYDKLAYPYIGDINAPRQSYIRFRIDKLPADGLEIIGGMNNHAYPYYSTPAFYLNPAGLSMEKPQKHAATGFTRWYCIQDVKRAPLFNGVEVTVRLMDLSVVSKGARGATQFAVFPHQDAVVRTIGWDEPDGLIISMQPNFEDNQHQLRTVRDNAREHYELALAATGGTPGPLARTDGLLLTNYSASALGDDYDYLAKSMRLLGFNAVGIPRSLQNHKNYGGAIAEGTSWEVSHLPFDEARTHEQYNAYYRDYFKNLDPEAWKEVNVFQISDEPSEVLRPEMSAPLWRYVDGPLAVAGQSAEQAKATGPRWLDLTGGSDLHTRRVDLSNCVMEGKITKFGGWIGFRVGIDNATNPTRYAYWHIGKVAPNNAPENVAVGKVGFEGILPQPFYVLRPAAVMGEGSIPFKVVYEGARAALYINGLLVQEHKDLPPTGGLGLTGAPRAVTELRIRPIRKGEHIANEFQLAKEFVKREKDDAATPDLDDTSATTAPADPPLKDYVERDWTPAGGVPDAHAGFRRWAAARGLTPQFFGEQSWDAVQMLTVKELVRNREEARLYYWSRRYSGYLTPRMFAIAAEEVRHNAPNKNMFSFVGLSGHSLYFPSEMPLDMFEMGNQGGGLMPGISDWMSYGGWRFDSHQAVAYSVAPFNAGARRWEKDGSPAAPASFPMMHCVWPSLIRSYTMLANQVKYLSYYTFGPYYASPGDYWSESPGCYEATGSTCNRVAKVDDILCAARMRPSRVALLYAHSTEYWNAQSAFADRRAAFLALSHEYFQPELVTEDQIAAGALKHYDALYVMDPWVSAESQNQIIDWVGAGGLLWTSADALTHDELNQPLDALALLVNLHREFAPSEIPKLNNGLPDPKIPGVTVEPIKGEIDFRKHTVVTLGMPRSIKADGARIRARYNTGLPAWLEWNAGKGKIVYIAHRAGLTYTSKATRPNGYPDIWADTGRATMTLPLLESKIRRELVLSEQTVMASPMSTPDGTVIILYNMRPSPLKNLAIELQEPAKPSSVQRFEGVELVDLPFDYHDGKVVMTLPVMNETQMILVRRKAAPADVRLEEQHQRTLAELNSKEWESLSAGAWFAGSHPQWKLADRLVPMLNDGHWQVRRSAAEALGRLAYQPSAENLVSRAGTETDTNALGEEALALGRLHYDGVVKLSMDLLDREDPMIRRLAVQAVEAHMTPSADHNAASAESRQAASLAVARALSDPNLRVRRAGISLIFRLDPARAIDLAVAAFGDPAIRATQERPDWISAITSSEPAFAEYVRRGLPGGDELLLLLGAARVDPALAHAVESRLVELDKAWPDKVAAVVIFQGDKSLARRMFEARDQLLPKTAAYVPHALEHAFDARLGNNLEDWGQWLKEAKLSSSAAAPKS